MERGEKERNDDEVGRRDGERQREREKARVKWNKTIENLFDPLSFFFLCELTHIHTYFLHVSDPAFSGKVNPAET